jgi:hypothetical protein
VYCASFVEREFELIGEGSVRIIFISLFTIS